MAFQAPVSLQTVVSTASEAWPSLSSVLSTPWKTLRQRPTTERKPALATGIQQGHKETRDTAVSAPGKSALSFMIPECLNAVPTTALRFQPSYQALFANHGLRAALAAVPTQGVSRCNPYARSLPQTFVGIRSYSTLRSHFSHLNRSLSPSSNNIAKFDWAGLKRQRRTLFGSTTSRNLLAHLEQTANNNPSSATAQNAFYSALLRANMPEIVVERYQTNRYASNPACETLYLRALERVGQSDKAGTLAPGQGQNLNNEQLQAIGQAVGAQARGGNIAISRTGSGAKQAPLYVVVEESMGNTIFKWVKFFLWFALLTYLSLVAITVIIETTSVVKKIGGSQNAEARPEMQTTRFSDVHGCDEAKEELQELVEFLKAPDKFNALGGKLPKGILLVGPPGTGKTLLARAVAGEAGVPFFYMSGSEFEEVYVGVGAKRVRELFNAARSKAPSIVFIDELDAVGGKRNERDAAYSKQTLNQLLTDLDGFDQNSGVIFLAATNFPQLLDKALTRPGRFDRNVVVPLPDVRGRVAILKHHMRNVQIGTDVDAAVIARGTIGFSGADLENVVNQAAVRASKIKAKKVTMTEFEWARDKIIMGAERKSTVIQQKDKVMTAYHEGGHALIALFSPDCDPLYKVTVMPRGMALGITSYLPEMDKVSMAKKEYLAHIAMSMGGMAAEELIYGPDNVSSGVSGDLQTATSIAYAMVTQMGMSDELGPVDLHSDYARLSAQTKMKIENEVKRILDESYARARKLLTEHRVELDRLATALVEYETLAKDEVEKVVKGEKLADRLPSASTSPLKLPENLMPPAVSPPLVGPGGLSGSAQETRRK